MSDFLLNNYEVSWPEKLMFLTRPVYCQRHIDASLEAKTWQGRTFHLVVGAIESTFAIGPLIALIEACIAVIWQALRENGSRIKHGKSLPDKPPPALPPVVEDVIYPPFKEDPICDEDSEPVLGFSEENIEPVLERTEISEFHRQRRENAALILTTKGFERDEDDRPNLHGYKGEVQGTSALRFATAKATKEDPSAISPSALKEQRELNLEQYLILKLKRFGHVFNLKGNISLPSGQSVNLEGFSEAFTVPMIASSFEAYAKSSDRYSFQDREWIVKNFNQTTSSDYTEPDDIQFFSIAVQDPQFRGPISLGTGHHWHSTGTMFYGNYLIFCNRGSGDDEPGIHVYFLSDRSLITEGIIWEMTKRQEVFGGDVFGLDRIVKHLGGELVHYERMNSQSVGNCTYTSMQCVLFATAVIRQLMNFFEDGDNSSHLYTDPDIWHQTFQALKPSYDEFVAFDQELILEDMLEEMKEWLEGITPFGQHPLESVYRGLLDIWKSQTRGEIPHKYEHVYHRFS